MALISAYISSNEISDVLTANVKYAAKRANISNRIIYAGMIGSKCTIYVEKGKQNEIFV